MIMLKVLFTEDRAEIKQLFIKVGFDIDDIRIHLTPEYEGEPHRYQIMTITVSGDENKMEKFRHQQLEDFKEQHPDMSVEYISGSTYKRKSTCTFEFWKY